MRLGRLYEHPLPQRQEIAARPDTGERQRGPASHVGTDGTGDPVRTRSEAAAMRRSIATIALLLVALTSGCPESPSQRAEVHDFDSDTPAIHPALAAQSAEFEQRVVRVTEGVYVAIGFGLANSILIEGVDGTIVIDAMGTVETARAVREAFEAVTTKPIRAIIYTHNHADHVFGGRGFVEDPIAAGVEVIAHATTEYYIDRVVGILRPVLSRRSDRMFGVALPSGPAGHVNCGIGPALEIDGTRTLGLLRPTRTFEERLSLRIAGVQLELVHAPGETNDQLFVWLPEKRVLLPGDNIYKAFPNLYTIRGTLYRDVLAWSQSLDAMRALRPAYLVPSHTSPIEGEAAIDEVLLAYRDAIQFVHDQTIRGMNDGLTPDELVRQVQLPKHLASHPYLQELYGTVEWSVRSIFTGYLGWFDGNAVTLSPVDAVERARATIDLMGGINRVISAASEALSEGRAAWAAELVQHVLTIAPGHDAARAVQIDALRELGRASLSPNARNYHLTQALELERGHRVSAPPIDESVLDLLHGVPIENFMRAMPVRLDAGKAEETDTLAVFEFADTAGPAGVAPSTTSDAPNIWSLHVRRGVAALSPGDSADPDLRVRTSAQSWKEVATGIRNPAAAFASGEIRAEGGPIALARFLSLFR